MNHGHNIAKLHAPSPILDRRGHVDGELAITLRLKGPLYFGESRVNTHA